MQLGYLAMNRNLEIVVKSLTHLNFGDFSLWTDFYPPLPHLCHFRWWGTTFVELVNCKKLVLLWLIFNQGEHFWLFLQFLVHSDFLLRLRERKIGNRKNQWIEKWIYSSYSYHFYEVAISEVSIKEEEKNITSYFD